MNGIVFEPGTYGLRAVITAPWHDKMKNELLKAGVLELELNDGKGWRGPNLDFLESLPHLRSLKLFDFKIHSDTEVHFLHELRELELITFCDTEIRFSEFPSLEQCALQWRQKSVSIFDVLSLKELFIDGYTGRDVTPFGKLSNLQSLAIMNARVETLHGLSTLKKLRSLRLGRLVCLGSLDGIERIDSLEELEIQRCRKIGSIEQVARLKNLRKLHINDCGEIESLKPIANLELLQSVLFYESTNVIDGDLVPLTQLSNLSNISFKNRRHYSHRREDFGVAYTGVKA